MPMELLSLVWVKQEQNLLLSQVGELPSVGFGLGP